MALELKRDSDNGFADIYLIHNSLPELSLGQVDTACEFLGKKLAAPLLINAMTGGHPAVTEINRSLARAARVTGIAMAVGSQRAGLEEPEVAYTYQVVREENPDGVILANLSAGSSWEDARAAVEMIRADALQLYLNVPQEMTMQEGERDFCGILKNISEINRRAIGVPLVIKEVGFGMSREVIGQLANTGISYIDVGGSGGTDFIAIEQLRCGRYSCPELCGWGIPTAVSLLEGLSLDLPLNFIATGGMRTVTDIAKALVLGAKLVGIVRPFLQILTDKSPEELIRYIEGMKNFLKTIMVLLGVKNVSRFTDCSAIITGNTAAWLRDRGIDVRRYARRSL